MLKDGFARCTPAVHRPTYKPQKGRQRFPVGADSISARGGSRRRALSSGRGPGMPGPYRVAIVPGGMTFLRAMRRAACPQAAADVCHSGKVRGSPPYIQTAKGAAAISRGRNAAFFCAKHKKSPTVRSRERWGQNAISRPLKRRRAKRQNGGAACYWQEPHRRGKQPVDGSRLVMVSRR